MLPKNQNSKILIERDKKKKIEKRQKIVLRKLNPVYDILGTRNEYFATVDIYSKNTVVYIKNHLDFFFFFTTGLARNKC